MRKNPGCYSVPLRVQLDARRCRRSRGAGSPVGTTGQEGERTRYRPQRYVLRPSTPSTKNSQTGSRGGREAFEEGVQRREQHHHHEEVAR